MTAHDPLELARDFVADLRAPNVDATNDIDGDEDELDAIDLLRFGADEVDDETLWQAALAIAELLDDDGERWMFADGVVDESIATRPALEARWRAEYDTNQSVQEIYRVMHDPSWNSLYDSTDDEYPAGWWSEGAWWRDYRAAGHNPGHSS